MRSPGLCAGPRLVFDYIKLVAEPITPFLYEAESAPTTSFGAAEQDIMSNFASGEAENKLNGNSYQRRMNGNNTE